MSTTVALIGKNDIRPVAAPRRVRGLVIGRRLRDNLETDRDTRAVDLWLHRVTLRGYEPSSQPRNRDYTLGTITLETIAGDVLAFIDQPGGGRAHLIGHDWGAAITYTAGAMAPDRLKSLTAIAVPHSGRFVNEAIRFPKQLVLSWYMGLFQLRGISERVVARKGYAFIRSLWRDRSPGWEAPIELVDDVIDTLRAPGVTTAALSYYRAALAPSAFTPTARCQGRWSASTWKSVWSRR